MSRAPVPASCAILSLRSTGGTGSETPRLHHVARRRGCRVAISPRLISRCGDAQECGVETLKNIAARRTAMAARRQEIGTDQALRVNRDDSGSDQRTVACSQSCRHWRAASPSERPGVRGGAGIGLPGEGCEPEATTDAAAFQINSRRTCAGQERAPVSADGAEPYPQRAGEAAKRNK